MKNELKLPFYLAFKSIRRGRKWTLALTIVLMSVAFVNLIFVSALFNGIVEGSNQQIMNTLTGNVYMTPKQNSSYINNKNNLMSNISNIDGVKAVASGFQIPARIDHNSLSGIWPVISINPTEYSKVINISKKMYAGQYLNSNDVDKIIIGRQISGGDGVELNSSSLKNVSIGDKVDVTFNGFKKTFTVKGIFYTKYTVSDSRAFITEKSFSSIYPNMAGKATEINIKTSTNQQGYVLNMIKHLDSTLDSYLWSESAGVMKSVSSSFISINVIMTLVGTIIAAVTTFIVIYVDIINRRRQIGILRAIGIRPYIIILSYVILAAIYATLGILLGSLIFSLILVPYFIAHPFSLPIVDAVLNLTWIDYIARVEILSWVAVISGLIPAAIVTRAKMIDVIIGR